MSAMKFSSGYAEKRDSKDSSTKWRVQVAIASLEAEGRAPSFYQVAKRAGVARSTLYRNEALRVCVEHARERFSARSATMMQMLDRDDLLRQNRSLRVEVEALQQALADARGECAVLKRRQAIPCGSANRLVFVYGVCHLPEAV